MRYLKLYKEYDRIDEQCSGTLQGAMSNPNDPKNAKILAGSDKEIDAKVNYENGVKKWELMSKQDEAAWKKQMEEDERANKDYIKANEKSFNDRFNISLNMQGEKISRDDRKKLEEGYKAFAAKTSGFDSAVSKYKPLERFSFIGKAVNDQSIYRKMNVMLGAKDPFTKKMTIDEMWKAIVDFGGFDKFIGLVKTNFPGVCYPDDPHKND